MTDHEHLREAATALRACAADAQAEIENMLRNHPADAGIWTGPAAATFYDVSSDARRRLDVAADDLRAYADALDARADQLEANGQGS